MNVYMIPSPTTAKGLAPSGITTVLAKYAQHAESVGLQFVDNSEDADVVAIHAGMGMERHHKPTVAHCHGLYWTAHYNAAEWEWGANAAVIESLRVADVITVPSEWVAETIRRDLRIQPVVLPHGIDFSEWHPQPDEMQYALWNKNRTGDVCDPTAVSILASRFPKFRFLSTFINGKSTPNVRTTGLLAHDKMRPIVMGAHIYLATTKETFGIGTLEAMASGVPILGFNTGGTSSLVKHGINGYLARPNDYDDLAEGFRYCLEHHDALGNNGRLLAQQYDWQRVMEKLQEVYKTAIRRFNLPHAVTVVIPCFNKSETLVRAVNSAVRQTLKPDRVIVVNNNSTDDFQVAMQECVQIGDEADIVVMGVNESRQGVAHARNTGVELSTTRYVCCLDADDEIAPEFLSSCVSAMQNRPEIGLTYTKLLAVDGDKSTISAWPDKYQYDAFLEKRNQVPTCCVFRRDLFMRLGGYRQRYAPHGAGAEDAELWLRMGAYGYGGLLADSRPLFVYHLGGAVSGDRSYQEPNWLFWHPWIKHRALHPFASQAAPARKSHQVRYYDEPTISVIIPCIRDHSPLLVDVFDSLEAQTFARWEAILVWDGDPGEKQRDDVTRIYPYVRQYIMNTPVGAGAARNLGVRNARSELLLFLDADDWLEPSCLEQLYNAYKGSGAIAYSNYFGHSYVTREDAEKVKAAKKLIGYDPDTRHMVALHRSLPYDCHRALQQPHYNNGQFYIWNIITSLTPRAWHDKIGGFDEKMASWEDWDYWLRMARAGYCFDHVEEPLVNYRFYTGVRREIGRQGHANLLDYLQAKYKGSETMPCSGCGGRRSGPVPTPARYTATASGGTLSMNADETVMVRLIDGNYGEHVISIRGSDNVVRNYGSRKEGDEFLMRREDAARYPGKFMVIAQKAAAASADNVRLAPPPPPPQLPESGVETETVEKPEVVEEMGRKATGRGRRPRK